MSQIYQVGPWDFKDLSKHWASPKKNLRISSQNICLESHLCFWGHYPFFEKQKSIAMPWETRGINISNAATHDIDQRKNCWPAMEYSTQRIWWEKLGIFTIFTKKRHINGSAFALHIDLKSPSMLLMENNPANHRLDGAKNLVKSWDKLPFPQLVGRIFWTIKQYQQYIWNNQQSTRPNPDVSPSRHPSCYRPTPW